MTGIEDIREAALSDAYYDYLTPEEFDKKLAEYENELRERIAQDIEASILPDDDSPTAHWLRSRAANIARGVDRG